LTKLTSLVFKKLGNPVDIGKPISTIPKEFSSLVALHSFRSINCSFGGSIPPQLASLTNLTIFNAPFNNLTGTLPSALTAIASLQTISLRENRLTGVILPAFSTLNLAILSQKEDTVDPACLLDVNTATCYPLNEPCTVETYRYCGCASFPATLCPLGTVLDASAAATVLPFSADEGPYPVSVPSIVAKPTLAQIAGICCSAPPPTPSPASSASPVADDNGADVGNGNVAPPAEGVVSASASASASASVDGNGQHGGDDAADAAAKDSGDSTSMLLAAIGGIVLMLVTGAVFLRLKMRRAQSRRIARAVIFGDGGFGDEKGRTERSGSKNYVNNRRSSMLGGGKGNRASNSHRASVSLAMAPLGGVGDAAADDRFDKIDDYQAKRDLAEMKRERETSIALDAKRAKRNAKRKARQANRSRERGGDFSDASDGNSSRSRSQDCVAANPDDGPDDDDDGEYIVQSPLSMYLQTPPPAQASGLVSM
jgi:hypothetical protein